MDDRGGEDRCRRSSRLLEICRAASSSSARAARACRCRPSSGADAVAPVGDPPALRLRGGRHARGRFGRTAGTSASPARTSRCCGGPAPRSAPNGANAPARRRWNLLAELLLLARQDVDREFEIGRHQALHAVAVEADQLAQEGDRQQVLAALLSCSKMICVSTERVMSSPVLASKTTKSSPPFTISARSSSVT